MRSIRSCRPLGLPRGGPEGPQPRTILGSLLVVALCVAVLHGQGPVAPSALTAPGPDSWPMHNGDYSGRRFSELTTIDSRTVASLAFGWTHRIVAAGPAGGGGA